MVSARMLSIDIYSYWWRGAGVYKVVKVPGLGWEEIHILLLKCIRMSRDIER